MVTRSDYPVEMVNAALGVLVEVMSLLGGENSQYIVLAGGWVPFFLISQDQEPHCGSGDIDLALDFERIPDAAYSSFLQRLSETGYVQDADSPAKFWRIFRSENGEKIEVRVDFIAGEYGGTGKSRRHQRVQDVPAQKARGCDLAFADYVPIEVEARMPDGSINSVKVNIAGVVPFLVMKGMTLSDRLKEKDAYDIGYMVRRYPGGPKALAAVFEPYRSNKLVIEGLSKIRAKFKTVDYWGPNAFVTFEQIDDEEDREIEKRDVFERVNAFLNELGIE